MQPNPEGRHCDRCASTVIDLTRVTRSQAEDIVRRHGGKVCGRVRADARGDAVFAPEPIRRGVVPMALVSLLAACAPETSDAPVAPAPHADVDRTVGLSLPTTGSFGGSLATGSMMPIGPVVPVVAHVDPPIVIEEPIGPTAEQIALTRRKHQRQRPPITPPPITHHMMGAMVMPPSS